MEKLIITIGLMLCTLVIGWFFWPKRKQFKKWTLPTKFGFVAGAIAFFGLPTIVLTYYKELTATPLEEYTVSAKTMYDGTTEFKKVYSRLFRNYRWDSYQLPLPKELQRTVTVGDCPSNECTKIRIAPEATENQDTRLTITFDSANLFELARDGKSANFSVLTTGTGEKKHEIVVQADPRLFTYNVGVVGSQLLFSEGEATLVCLPTHDYIIHVVDDSINSPKIQIDVKNSTFTDKNQCEFIDYFDSRYDVSVVSRNYHS